MKTLILLLVLMFGWYHTGFSASTRYDTAQFYWNYTDNPEVPGNTFILKCGTSSGNYSIQRYLPMDIRAVLIKNILPRNSGKYYCIIFVQGETDSNKSPRETIVTTRGNFVDY